MQKDLDLKNFTLCSVEIINFREFYGDVLSSEFFDKIDLPGIYGLHCLITSKTIIINCENILSYLLTDFDQLSFNRYEINEDLQEDFNNFRDEEFLILIFAVGDEWENQEKRENQVKKIETNWPYNLYI